MRRFTRPSIVYYSWSQRAHTQYTDLSVDVTNTNRACGGVVGVSPSTRYLQSNEVSSNTKHNQPRMLNVFNSSDICIMLIMLMLAFDGITCKRERLCLACIDSVMSSAYITSLRPNSCLKAGLPRLKAPSAQSSTGQSKPRFCSTTR
jgi:hypothetical protein